MVAASAAAAAAAAPGGRWLEATELIGFVILAASVAAAVAVAAAVLLGEGIPGNLHRGQKFCK